METVQAGRGTIPFQGAGEKLIYFDEHPPLCATYPDTDLQESILGPSAALCENIGHTYSSMGKLDEVVLYILSPYPRFPDDRSLTVCRQSNILKLV